MYATNTTFFDQINTDVLLRKITYPNVETYTCPTVFLYSISTLMAVNGVKICSLRSTKTYRRPTLNKNICRGWAQPLLMVKSQNRHSKHNRYSPLSQNWNISTTAWWIAMKRKKNILASCDRANIITWSNRWSWIF